MVRLNDVRLRATPAVEPQKSPDVAPEQPAIALPEIHRGALPATKRPLLNASLLSSGLLGWCAEKLSLKAVMLGVAVGLGFSPGISLAQATRNAIATERSIVYIGMNPNVDYEVTGLRERGIQVDLIKNSPQQDYAMLRGRTFNLQYPEQALAYAETLGLTGEKAQLLADILATTGDEAKDEMAKLAQVFYASEKGTRALERIIFSGHSVGSGIWGDDNGTISWDDVGKLALLFPNAARQIKDLHVAACYTGGEHSIDQFKAIFPNLETVWAYEGSAPGAASGAITHLTRWEKASRGKNPDAVRRELADGTRKGENVVVWTTTRGYQALGAQSTLEERQNSYQASQNIVAEFMAGTQEVTNSQTGPLRDHYNAIQHLLQRTDLPAEQRPVLEAERDTVIRLLYYSNVRTRFTQTHATALREGYAAVGLEQPDYSRLSRKEAMDAIQAFDAARAGKNDPAADRLFILLSEGLRDLSPRLVPPAWI